MEKDTRERIISVLENGAQVRVDIDDEDGSVLRISKRLSRTKLEDLGVIVITEDGLDLSNLRDGQTDWHLRHLADMGKRPLVIKA